MDVPEPRASPPPPCTGPWATTWSPGGSGGVPQACWTGLVVGHGGGRPRHGGRLVWLWNRSALGWGYSAGGRGIGTRRVTGAGSGGQYFRGASAKVTAWASALGIPPPCLREATWVGPKGAFTHTRFTHTGKCLECFRNHLKMPIPSHPFRTAAGTCIRQPNTTA